MEEKVYLDKLAKRDIKPTSHIEKYDGSGACRVSA